MKIERIMSRPVVTCRTDDTLDVAAQHMWAHDCGALPIVDEDGATVGMITDRDICMAALSRGAPLHLIGVSTVMTTPVFACHARDSVDEAENLMSTRQVRRIPIVDDNNRPIGFLSLNDIARATVSVRKKNGYEHALTQTIAAISRPRGLAIERTR